MKITRQAFGLAFILGLLATSVGATAQSEPNVRERLSIDDNWRFTKGDPTSTSKRVRYDVLPVPAAADPHAIPDVASDATTRAAGEAASVLKPWILPCANDFIDDPANRHRRPAGDPETDISYVRSGFDDSKWERVTLPHDWAIAGPFEPGRQGVGGGMGRLPTPGVGWYRRKLDLSAADSGKQIFLDVDGAMAYAAVWLNGHFVGGWPSGYASWELNLTPAVQFGGDNELVIRLEDLPDSSRWYTGAGLYRNVWLTKTGPVHVRCWGTRVTTPVVSAASAQVALDVTIDSHTNVETSATVTTDVFNANADGHPTGDIVVTLKPEAMTLPAHSSQTTTLAGEIPRPRLWGPPPLQSPNRYVAVTRVWQGKTLLDRYETCFGVRTIRWDPNVGVLVNGQHVPLQGTNNHHDLGPLGAAFNVRAAERQLEMLREMGCNALRMSHNPPAPELLDLADRMGFLVLDEAFDVWYRRKTPFDFHLIFPDWHEPDLRAMVRRDRNHPSVILWSIGNEVGEQYTGASGAAVAKELVRIVHEEDPTRPTTTAMNWAKADMPLPATVDVIALNYQGAGIRKAPGQFPNFRAQFPDKVILSSETAAAVSSRGFYLFPVLAGNSGPVRPGEGGDPNSQQVSDYGLYAADFGSSPDRVFASNDKAPYVAGEFVWSGFDYLGEPTPYYGARSSYFGIVDLAGFKKERFWLYQSRWRPDLPMAHILPHWTWPERVGQVTPVHVFTSGDEGELFLNGKSLGKRRKAAGEYRLRWDAVVYAPGELKVVTFKNAKPWATDVVRTAGVAHTLDATADRPSIADDGKDLCFVEVRVTDDAGITVPRATDEIHFSVDGPGEIVATDNGDSTCFVPFPSHNRPAFNGRCLAIVRAIPGTPGTITLHVASGTLKTANVSIDARAN